MWHTTGQPIRTAISVKGILTTLIHSKYKREVGKETGLVWEIWGGVWGGVVVGAGVNGGDIKKQVKSKKWDF